MCLGSLGDRQPAVVTVEAGLYAVRRREVRRYDLELEGDIGVRPAAQNVVTVADGRPTRTAGVGCGGGEGESQERRRVLRGDPFRPVVTDANPIAMVDLSDVDGREVVVQAAVWIHRSIFGPSQTRVHRV